MHRPWGVSHGIIRNIMWWWGWLEGLDCEAVIQDVPAKLWAWSQLKHKRLQKKKKKEIKHKILKDIEKL